MTNTMSTNKAVMGIIKGVLAKYGVDIVLVNMEYPALVHKSSKLITPKDIVYLNDEAIMREHVKWALEMCDKLENPESRIMEDKDGLMTFVEVPVTISPGELLMRKEMPVYQAKAVEKKEIKKKPIVVIDG